MANKVLIVDDNQAERQESTKAFELYSCDVLEADSVDRALEMAKKDKISLMILDPRTNMALLEKVKTDFTLRSVPVVIHTADALRDHVIKASKLGIRDYVLKPIPPDRLGERIERIIELPRKKRNINDTIRILVLENKPLILEQIKSVCEGTNWEVVPMTKDTEALEYIANRLPDVILASLSMPNDQAFSLFHTLSSDERTGRIPYFGLSVKNAGDEQGRAQQDGMTGIFTKPLDINDMRQRLTRAVNVDVSERFLAIKENVLHATFPATADAIATEMAPFILPKISSIVDEGLNKILLDLTQVTTTDTPVIRLLIQIIESCDQLGVAYAVVGASQLATKAQAFEETKSITIFEDVDQGLKSFEG